MKARVLLIVATLVVAVMGLAVVAASSGWMVATADATVPFKASLVTHPVTVGMEDGVLTIQIPAEGQVTHLGRSEWYAEMWVDTNQNPWTQGSDEMTFTAANGDQLVGTYDGYARPTGPDSVEFWGVYEITHGTGRFEGTTGEGEYRGECAGGEGILYFDGMLSK
jgi:hypothetical protein